MRGAICISAVSLAMCLPAVEKVRLTEKPASPNPNRIFACGFCIVDAPHGELLATIGDEIRRSKDGGRTWGDAAPQNAVKWSRNLLRLRDGRLMKVWSVVRKNRLGNKLGAEDWYVSFSPDEGRTWSGKVPVLNRGERVYLMNDRPIMLSTGRILIPFSKHPDHLLDKGLETVGWAGACFSDDSGKTWREGKWLEPTVADQLCEPMVFERRDGTLVMLARTGKGFLYETQSKDGGESWSVERPTTLRQPCAPFAVRTDPYTGRVFVVWNNTFAGLRIQFPRTPFCLGVSDDEGRTWRLVMELGANPNGSYGYPTIHFTKDSILVAHYESDGTRNFIPSTQTGELDIVSRKEIAGK